MNTLTIKRGDDIELEFTFKDIDGNAIDLTGSRVYFTVKRYANDLDGVALITKDDDFDGDGTDGICEVWLEAGDTNISIGVYSYDIQIKDHEGYIFSSEVGKLKVVKDITTRTTGA